VHSVVYRGQEHARVILAFWKDYSVLLFRLSNAISSQSLASSRIGGYCSLQGGELDAAEGPATRDRQASNREDLTG
jgi:hypothetical protein